MCIFMTLCVAAVALFLLPSQKAAAASFDCSRARLPVEHMVCADALLSDLDEKLFAAFQAAGDRQSPGLMAAEAHWLQQRNSCTTPICVSTLYRARIAELSQSAEPRQTAPSSSAAPAPGTPAPKPAATDRKQLRLPSKNDMYVRQDDILIRLVEKTPKDVRNLRYFQNYDNSLRESFQFLTADQQAKYSKILDDWWASALKEIGAHGISLSDIAILQNIAPHFPSEREVQLRQLATKGLSYGPGPALTNANLPQDGSAVEPSDREIWEGTAPCVPKNVTYDFVVVGPLEKANSAYVMWQGDQRTIVRYTARLDVTIGTIDLSNMSIIQNNDFVALPKSTNAELVDSGSTVVIHTSPTCEVRLQKKQFPEAVLQAIARAKTDPTYVPAQGLPFCVSMLAWSHQIEAGAPGLDLSKGLQPDPRTKLMVASAFHNSMTEKFLGRPLTTLDTRQLRDEQTLRKWLSLARECLAHPLYFDDNTVLVKLIIPFLNYLGSKEDELAIIPTMENRVRQVAQAGGNFDATVDGFAKLQTYVSPLEAQLAPALKQVRQVVLKPLIDREAEIAIAAIRAEPPTQQGGPRPLDRLRVFADMIDALGSVDQVGEITTAEAEATGIVNTDLTEIIALRRKNIDYAGADIFSLSHLKQWKDGTAKELERFSEFASYKTAMESVRTTMEVATPQMVAGLASAVEQAKDLNEIRAISGAAAELQTDPSDLTSPMWQAYARGLDAWFAAHMARSVEVAAAPVTGHNKNMASIFHSQGLKNPKIVGALFDHDFLALRNAEADAFAATMWMVSSINRSCPGARTEKFMRAVLERSLGRGAFGTSKDVQNKGAEILLYGADQLTKAFDNPGGFLGDMVHSAAAQDRAVADGQLVTEIACNDPDMQTFLGNAEDFVVDPTSGIPNDKLSVADMCTRALPGNDPMTTRYCTCASPILKQRLTAVEGAYLKSDPRRNYSTVVNLLPSVRQDLRKCQQ